MKVLRNIFVCTSNSDKKNIKTKSCSTRTKDVKFVNNINRIENQIITNLSYNEIAENILSIMDKVKFTSINNKLYLISKEWFVLLINFVTKPSKNTFPPNINYSNLFNDSINNNNIIFIAVTFELINYILKYFILDSKFILYIKFDNICSIALSNKSNTIDSKYINQETYKEFKENSIMLVKYQFNNNNKQEIFKTYTEIIINDNNSNTILKAYRVSIFKNDNLKENSSLSVNNCSKLNSTKVPIKDSYISDKEKLSLEDDVNICYNKSNNVKNNLNIKKYNNYKTSKESIDLNLANKTNNTLNTTSHTKMPNPNYIIFSSLKTLTLKPKGIYNPSVYCFMNSAMQCLVSIPELNNYFLNKNYLNKAKCNKPSACNALNKFIKDYISANSILESPSSLFNLCHSFLSPNKQHDCHEFLIKLLEKIQLEINGKANYNLDKAKYFYEAWIVYNKSNCSIIDSTFIGLFKSKVKCHKCNYISETYDPFMDLSLSFTSNNASINKMLDYYFRSEEINCDYKCNNCKKTTSITKLLEISILPPVLICQFKRFNCNGKFNGQVSFDEYLNLKKYIACDFESNKVNEEYLQSTKYELFALSEHIGNSLYCGHYIAYAKRNKEWYKFNDNRVSLCDNDGPSGSGAYMLFYKRVL